MSLRLLHDRVEVSVRKPVLLDAREEPEERRRVGDVRGLHLAGTAGEEAADAAAAVDDDRARIARGGEARLIVVGEDGPLLRGLMSFVVKVLTNVREYAVSSAYRNARGFAVLYD